MRPAWSIKAPASAYVVPDEVQDEQLQRRGIDVHKQVSDLAGAIALTMQGQPMYGGTVEPDERARRRAKAKQQRRARRANRGKR